MEISRPSHSFLMVEIVALRLRPLMILFTVDWVTPLREHSLLMEIFRHHRTIVSAAFAQSFAPSVQL